ERSLVREALDLLCRQRKVRDELAAAFDLQRPSFLVDRVAPVVLLYHSPQRVSVPAQVHLPHLCEAAGTWQGAPTTLFLTLRMAQTIRVYAPVVGLITASVHVVPAEAVGAPPTVTREHTGFHNADGEGAGNRGAFGFPRHSRQRDRPLKSRRSALHYGPAHVNRNGTQPTHDSKNFR